MILWRNFIVLFGGFYEAMREVKWYNDLYFFSLQERRWVAVPPPRQNSAQPKPRSGHMMFLHSTDDVMYVYGGFAKEKTPGAKKEHIEHEDMWSMSLKPLVQAKGATAATSTAALDWGKLAWQRVSKKGEYPTARCGAVAAVFKNKALIFGGVFDEEGPRHALLSSFFNDLFAFDMDRKRWYQLGLKQVKDKAKLQEERNAKKQQRKQAAAVALAAARAKLSAAVDGGDEGDATEIKFRRVGHFEDDDEDDEDDEDIDDEVIIDPTSGGRVSASTLRQNEELFGFIDDNGDVVYMHIEDDADEEQATNSALPDVDGATSALKDAAIAVEETLPEAPRVSAVAAPPSAPAMPVMVARASRQAAHASATAVGGLVLRSADDFARYFGAAVEPCARIHACAMMRGASLVVYGGVTEANDVEITLDDCWALDINKRDSWRRVLPGTMHTLEWKGVEDDDHSRATGSYAGDSDEDGDGSDSDDSENSDESGSDSDESDSDEDKDSDSDADKKKARSKKKGKKDSKKDSRRNNERGIDEVGGDREGIDDEDLVERTAVTAPSVSRRHGGSRHGGRRAELDELRDQLSLTDSERTPLAGESLRDFYARTQVYWATLVLQQWQEAQAGRSSGSEEALSEKEIKRQGFALAGERYEELLPTLNQLNELEAEQLEDEDRHRGRTAGGKGKERDPKDKSSKDKDAKKKKK